MVLNHLANHFFFKKVKSLWNFIVRYLITLNSKDSVVRFSLISSGKVVSNMELLIQVDKCKLCVNVFQESQKKVHLFLYSRWPLCPECIWGFRCGVFWLVFFWFGCHPTQSPIAIHALKYEIEVKQNNNH